MALTQTAEACSPDAYTGPADYGDACAKIDGDCKAACDALTSKHNAIVDEHKAECERQTRILEGKEEDHADEKADRKEEDMDVSAAKKAVAEKAHCRPELFAAKEDLAREEAIPNDDSAAIDAECKAKKLVMEKEQCVEVLRRAEAVLSKEKDDHKEESHEESQAASALPPQEERKRTACAAPPAAPACPCSGDQSKKDALLKQADAYIADLLAEYLRQKKILEDKEGDHSAEKQDVDQQEQVVAGEWSDVKNAKETVKDHAHCPPDLEKAKAELEKANAELAKQQGIPNDTPEDIDAECEAQKAVLEAKEAVRKAEQCMEELRRAEAVLGTQNGEHSGEKSDLNSEQSQENHAEAALPPQEKIVCDLKAALDAARAARDTLPCGKKSSPEPKSEPEEKKSGAARVGAATTLVVVLLSALLQA